MARRKKREKDQWDHVFEQTNFHGMTQEKVLDRNGTFEPRILPKHRKRVPLFNDQIVSMYSFGMTNRDIKSHLERVYNVEVSPELTSRVTDAACGNGRAGRWKNPAPLSTWTRCG
jgi:hypothetical protein